ncbi:hypothetical protein IG631_06164 [Alternaria alternata]|nr:hypothetical protein IG631_06164 [Alternaria alternata]
MQGICAVEGLDVQVCDVRLAIRQLCAYFKLLVEHHVIFPQPSLAIIYAQDALLHLHLIGSAAPRYRVVLALLASGTGDGYAAFGESEASARTGFLDARRGEVVC